MHSVKSFDLLDEYFLAQKSRIWLALPYFYVAHKYNKQNEQV